MIDKSHSGTRARLLRLPTPKQTAPIPTPLVRIPRSILGGLIHVASNSVWHSWPSTDRLTLPGFKGESVPDTKGDRVGSRVRQQPEDDSKGEVD